jgi:hydroxysqualene dehydroxylase
VDRRPDLGDIVTTAIIGGGYAGMAAAVELAEAGIEVVVFEAAKELGGRARRVRLNGLPLDNGQHILLGAYRETLQLIARVRPDAAQAMLRRPLDIFAAGGFRLTAARLPAPLDLAVGLALTRGLSVAERVSVAAFFLRMRLSGFRLPGDLAAGDLLRDARQSARCIRLLWEPLCVSALNTPLAQASAQVFLHVLQDGLFGRTGDSDLVIPREDLTSLFPAPAAAFVAARGGSIRTGTTIRAVTAAAHGYRLHHGAAAGDESGAAAATYENVIIATSPHRLPPLIAALPALARLASAIEAFDYQPISTCYLQYAETVALPAPMFGMFASAGRGGAPGFGQWAFDRGALSGVRGLIAVVISASGPHQALSQDELARRLHAELADLIPALPPPIWSRVITEKRATFSCGPGLSRPAMRTAMPEILLAGDYVESRYPATLEAAVSSGRAAARCIVEGVARSSRRPLPA